VILVDSNFPMYLVGADHPLKVDAQRLLERCVADGERIVTDAEVFQEILHRYVALERRDMIQPAFDVTRGIVDEVLPIERQDVERAKDVVLGAARLSARDALHVAVMERHGIDRILSFDRDFDRVPGLVRVSR
jgi:predicted nucleic acid-binding protein